MVIAICSLTEKKSLGSLASMTNVSNFTTCISLNNPPCLIRLTLIDSNSDEYNQGLRYYLFIVNLDRCNESCNTLDDPSGKICVPNKTDVNLSGFKMITRTNESKFFSYLDYNYLFSL